VHETLPSRNAWWYAYLAGYEAMIEARAGRLDEGKKMLYRLIERTDPDDAEVRREYHCRLAEVHRLGGDFDSSVIIMEELVTADPSFRNRLHLGASYVGAGRHDEAVTALETAMARYDLIRLIYPTDAVTGHYYLARAYERAGRTEEAVKQYETFLDIWKNADEEIKILDTARTHLAKLKGEL